MNVKHIWSVLCKESIVNQDDNLISLIGILEEINSVMTPLDKNYKKADKFIIPFNYELVNYWIKNVSKEVRLDVKVEILDPNAKQLSESLNTSVFPENSKRLRTRFKIQGIPVTENGRYSVRISMKEDEDKIYKVITELPLDVKFRIEEPLKKPRV